MAVKIRLARAGAKKNPYYHVVAAESTARRDGRFIEAIGAYDPVARPVKKIEFNADRLAYWLGVGAQPTETVKGLIRKFKKAEETKLAKV
jgi:small subunit ribosomal protein S16